MSNVSLARKKAYVRGVCVCVCMLAYVGVHVQEDEGLTYMVSLPTGFRGNVVLIVCCLFWEFFS